MKGTRWVAVQLVISVLAAIVGWLIPDGLNLLARVLGQALLTITPTERLLSSMVAFMFAVSVQLMIFMRAEMVRLARVDLPKALERRVASEARQAIDASLIRPIVELADGAPETVARMSALVKSVLTPMLNVDAHTREAYLVIMERKLATAERDIQHFSGDGLEVDIADHVQITRRLAQRSGTYMQIQRHAFLVPHEWTQEWMRMVAELPRQGTACEYVILMSRDMLLRERERVESMHRFLTKNKWTFRYCDVRDVLDSFGGALPTEWNLDLYDGRIGKLQELPAGRYQGGVKLRMTMFDLDRHNELRRFVSCVTRFAQKYSPALVASLAEPRPDDR